ncbi:MAG: DUF3426 domain-containing protein [Gammaproteobacteria bacterium]|nr:DUF3426 domain-containing protein [Gammaproteobacteria bacterium]
MYTQCPHCDTFFRVTDEQLAVADGDVRCSRCDRVFDANARLSEHLPDDISRAPARSADAAVETVASKYTGWEETAGGEPAAEHDQHDLPGLEFEREPQARPTERPPAGDERAADAHVPREGVPPVLWEDFARIAPPRRPWPTAAWATAALAAALALPVQYTYFHFEELAQRALLRPYLIRACEHISCMVPPRRKVEAIRLAEREIRSHPSVRDALLVTATLVNTASFAQPYPILELMLSDMEQRVVATRRFAPREYLGRDAEQDMPPDTPVQIAVELVDPGVHVTNYRFSFR